MENKQQLIGIEPTKAEINKINDPLSEKNDKVDIKLDSKDIASEYKHPLPQFNDAIDKSIKIPDKTEIAGNPQKFEAEKGVDKNGVNMAETKSVNTIAEDYVKGQEKVIEQKVLTLADLAQDKVHKLGRSI
jgi:hypothetical protein